MRSRDQTHTDRKLREALSSLRSPRALRENLVTAEIQRDTIDAIPQARWRRTVFEDVAKVSAASAAVHFGALHEEAGVGGRAHCAWNRLEETRPSRAALEFRSGLEQRLAATNTRKRPGTFFVQERARARALG